MFAEGRGPGLNDVALDFAGACVGMLAAGLVIGLLYLLFRPRGRHAAGRKRRRS
jgi:VanZ family protein